MSARGTPETPSERIGDRIGDPFGEPIGGRGESELSAGTSQGERRLPEHREEGTTQAPAAEELRPLARAFVALAQALIQDGREEDEE